MKAGDRSSGIVPRSAGPADVLSVPCPAAFLPARLILLRLLHGADPRLVPAVQDLVRIAVADSAGRQFDDAAGLTDDFGRKPVVIIPLFDQGTLRLSRIRTVLPEGIHHGEDCSTVAGVIFPCLFRGPDALTVEAESRLLKVPEPVPVSCPAAFRLRALLPLRADLCRIDQEVLGHAEGIVKISHRLRVGLGENDPEIALQHIEERCKVLILPEFSEIRRFPPGKLCRGRCCRGRNRIRGRSRVSLRRLRGRSRGLCRTDRGCCLRRSRRCRRDLLRSDRRCRRDLFRSDRRCRRDLFRSGRRCRRNDVLNFRNAFRHFLHGRNRGLRCRLHCFSVFLRDRDQPFPLPAHQRPADIPLGQFQGVRDMRGGDLFPIVAEKIQKHLYIFTVCRRHDPVDKLIRDHGGRRKIINRDSHEPSHLLIVF